MGQLDADDTAADDAQRLRHSLKVQCAGAVHYAGKICPGKWNLAWHGTCGDDGFVKGYFHVALFRGNGQGLCILEGGGSLDYGYAIGLHQACDAVYQLLDHGGLLGLDLCKVDAYVLYDDAALGRVLLDLIVEICGVDQSLGGNASHIQAGSSHGIFLDDGDFCTQLRCADSGLISARAGSDDCNLHINEPPVNFQLSKIIMSRKRT